MCRLMGRATLDIDSLQARGDFGKVVVDLLLDRTEPDALLAFLEPQDTLPFVLADAAARFVQGAFNQSQT